MTGIPIKAESMRSSTPPTPGSKSPASLSAASRFKSDSIRSPTTATAASTMPSQSDAREVPRDEHREHALRDQRAEAGGDDYADRALDDLVRADRGGELPAPVAPPDEVGARVRQHDRGETQDHVEEADLGIDRRPDAA